MNLIGIGSSGQDQGQLPYRTRKQAGDMTAPDPQSSNTGQNHIAKRAPSRHDDALWQMFDGLRDNIDPSILAMSTLLVIISVLLMSGGTLVQKRAAANRAPVR